MSSEMSGVRPHLLATCSGLMSSCNIVTLNNVHCCQWRTQHQVLARGCLRHATGEAPGILEQKLAKSSCILLHAGKSVFLNIRRKIRHVIYNLAKRCVEKAEAGNTVTELKLINFYICVEQSPATN